MKSFTDLSGQVFGRLTVVKQSPRINGFDVWECNCSCGVVKTVRRTHLLNGAVKSCGCYRSERARQIHDDITGRKFGRWTAISHSGNIGGEHCWLCRCECGSERNVQGKNLRSGMSKSCGCLLSETTTKRNTTHGLTKTKTYHAWSNMIKRCEDKNNNCFQRYGAVGISVCDGWHSFDNFLADMGEAPEGLTLDRIDGSKGYYKENCRWATATTQARNRTFKKTQTGVKGVTLVRGKFRALIGVGYRQQHIGYFGTLEEATKARVDAEIKYWATSSG